MTAIYLVWNNKGFALAGDSNLSVGLNEKSEWLDSVQKVFSIPQHQIAIAGSGAGMINGLDVNDILLRWANQMSTKEETLEDYFASFITWFATQDWPTNTQGKTSVRYELSTLEEALRADANAIKDNMVEAESAKNSSVTSIQHWENTVSSWVADITEMADGDYFNSDWAHRVNVCSSDYINSRFQINEEFYDQDFIDDENAQLSARQEFLDYIGKHRNKHLEKLTAKEAGFIDWILASIDAVWKEEFSEIYDSSNAKHQNLAFSVAELHAKRILVNSDNEDTLTLSRKAEIMLVGYGTEDLIPKYVSFEILPSINGFPRITIRDVDSPTYVWFKAVGVFHSVRRLVRGSTPDFVEELYEFLGGSSENEEGITSDSLLREDQMDDLRSVISKHASNRNDRLNRKISSLSLPRLGFVAKLLVQIEALESYLSEPLPGVGGDITVISISLNTNETSFHREI